MVIRRWGERRVEVGQGKGEKKKLDMSFEYYSFPEVMGISYEKLS